MNVVDVFGRYFEMFMQINLLTGGYKKNTGIPSIRIFYGNISKYTSENQIENLCR